MPVTKDFTIELVKFLAVIIVFNSHSEVLYGDYSFLATGGAIGDCLFFFVSGLTLFWGRKDSFLNWYKRRLLRIYPSVFGWCILSEIVFNRHTTLTSALLGGGNWFVTCILIYYFVLYFVRKYAESKPLIPFLITFGVIVAWYCFEDRHSFFMYGETYFKWVHYFLFMLLGGYIGNGAINVSALKINNVILLFISLIAFYGIAYGASRSEIISQLQIVSLIPLMLIIVALYKICSSIYCKSLERTKVKPVLLFISGLCFDIYLVQGPLFTDKFNCIFPLNLLIVFLIVLFFAYVNQTIGRFLFAVFQKEEQK